ncbi:ABC-type cobalt transport system, permease component [Candidatus Phytoplasma mali]|uniref:ABC-type cobalt transport system, permease component n=1 Tax=Phytoplasma mali (strain AT) TaxID=482235 RepID=B3R021_PHYMT|nr:energy-coupling factor transporter transmembrane component T [Candidatus Phytoplasma mali]CAP18558.1 ABC-type cobalt transport system, permease component [Candidatus Phytoplasma mali]
MTKNDLNLKYDREMIFSVSKSSLLQRIHPSFKILILFFTLFIIFRLPIYFPEVSDKEKKIFLIYGFLFFLLFYYCFFYNCFFQHFLEQIKNLRFLFLFSLLIQFESFENRISTKLLFAIPIYDWSGYNNFLILIFLVFFYNITKQKIFFKMIYFIFLLFLFFVFPSLILSLSKPLSNVQNYGLQTTSFLKSFFIFLRLIIIIMVIFVFNKSTSFMEINDGLRIILSPLKKIKIPVEIFTFMLSLIFISVPFLFQETEKILKAQTSRGMDLQNKNFLKKINNLLSLLIPIFVLVFKRSLILANAMEVRGYVLGAPRTKMIYYKVTKIDVFFTMTIVFVFFIINYVLIN